MLRGRLRPSRTICKLAKTDGVGKSKESGQERRGSTRLEIGAQCKFAPLFLNYAFTVRRRLARNCKTVRPTVEQRMKVRWRQTKEPCKGSCNRNTSIGLRLCHDRIAKDAYCQAVSRLRPDSRTLHSASAELDNDRNYCTYALGGRPSRRAS
jgi:hypothetical protein